MLDLRFILIIVLIICGNVNLTFGKKKNISYKSCDEICETGRCYYKDCKETIDCSGGLCTFWRSQVSIFGMF